MNKDKLFAVNYFTISSEKYMHRSRNIIKKKQMTDKVIVYYELSEQFLVWC